MNSATAARHARASARTAGREYPVRRCLYETLCQIGWPLFRVASFTSWCGHGQELIPVPDDREWAKLVPVIGRAK